MERVGKERWSQTPVTASVGLTMARADDDVASLLRRADAEAYAAKRAGGNRVIVSIPPQLERSGVMVNVEAREPLAGPSTTRSMASGVASTTSSASTSNRPSKRNTGA
ncbi:MAG: hypothetical protein QM778_36800 [Myxococcales bacterium]